MVIIIMMIIAIIIIIIRMIQGRGVLGRDLHLLLVLGSAEYATRIYTPPPINVYSVYLK